MSSGDGEDKRMIPVRSIFLRPDQWKRHWDGITPTKRSAHVRDRLELADKAETLFLRILDKSIPCSGELYYEVKRLMEGNHGRE